MAPEHAAFAGALDRNLHGLDGMGIFGADIDVAVGGADGDAGNGHALDQHEGIAFHDHAVGEGAGIALIGVAHDVFLLGPGLGDGAPFDAGGEARAAAAAQARIHHLLDDRLRSDGDRLLQSLVAAMGFVVLERARIDDADAGEGEPGLLLEERDVLDEAEGERMLAAVQHAGIEQAVDIGGLHRPVADTALRPRNLDRRLEPVHAARAGAHDLDVEAALLGGLEQSARHLFGADAKRTRDPAR